MATTRARQPYKAASKITSKTASRRTAQQQTPADTTPVLALDELASDGPMLISVTEAARRIGIGRTVLYPHVMSGRLPSVVMGSQERRVIAAAIPGFIAALWGEQRSYLAYAG